MEDLELVREIESLKRELALAKHDRDGLKESVVELKLCKRDLRNVYVSVEQFEPRRKMIDAIFSFIIISFFSAIAGMIYVGTKT